MRAEPDNPRVGAPEEQPTIWCRACDDQHTEPECEPDYSASEQDDGDVAYDTWKDDNIVAPISSGPLEDL